MDVEKITEIIKLLRVSINNYRIYPPASQHIAGILNHLYSTLTEYLESNNSLTIGGIQHKMLINGQEVKSLTDSFVLSVLSSREINGVIFKKGMELNELSIFLEYLSTRKEKAKEDVKIIDFLKSEGVKNITVNQLKYVVLKGDEEIVQKASSQVSHLKTDPAEFMTSLREIYDTIDEIKDAGTKKDMIKVLSEKIASLKPEEIRYFFDRPLPSKIEESGLRETVISSLPQEKIREIFNDILVWYEDIKKSSSSEFDAVEHLADLRSFFGKILTSPAAKNIPFRFYEELLRVGVLEATPAWVRKEESTLIFQVDKLLEKDSSELLDPSVRDSLPGMVEKLCQSELTEMAEKLTNKMVENLKHPSLKVKSDTMKVLVQISEVFEKFKKEGMFKSLEKYFLEAVEKETDADIYRRVIDLLGRHAFRLILENRYDESVMILSLLKQHVSPDVEPDKERREIINETLVKLAGEFSGVFVSDMKSNDERRQLQAMKIIIMLGDSASDILIQIIKETEDYRIRKNSARTLKNIGEKAVRRFVESLDLTISTSTLKRAVDVFDEFSEYDLMDKVSLLLEYPDSQIKRALLKYICVIAMRSFSEGEGEKASESKKLLISKLNDKDVVIDVVRILGELKSNESVDELIRLSKIQNPNLQEEICIALGKIGERKGMPVLIKFARYKKSIFSIMSKKAVPAGVRMRAIDALKKFSKYGDGSDT